MLLGADRSSRVFGLGSPQVRYVVFRAKIKSSPIVMALGKSGCDHHFHEILSILEVSKT